jgi:hypothetical protein
MNFNPPSPELVSAVNRRNAANLYINGKIKSLIEIFTPLVGQKVVATSGHSRFTAKVEKLVSGVTEQNDSVHAYFYFSYSSVYFKISFKDPSIPYDKWITDEIYLGRFDSDGILKDTITDKYLRSTDFDATFISETNQEIEELERQISKLKAKIPYVFKDMV